VDLDARRQDDAPAAEAFGHTLGADLRQRRAQAAVVAGDLELDEGAVRPPLFLKIAMMDDRAVLHDHSLIAHLLDVAQQVGADEHVHALFVLHLGYELEHAPAGGGIEAVGRLVEHDQLRSVHDRLGELRHLLHPERVGAQLAIPRLAEPHVKQDLVRLLERGFRWKTGELGHLAHEGDGRHVADEGVVLGHVADARARLAHAVRAIEAENARASGAGAQEAEQREDQRGLPRAVRAQQAHRLACTRHTEAAGDPVKDLPPPQPDFQVLQFNDRCGVHSINSLEGLRRSNSPTRALARRFAARSNRVAHSLRSFAANQSRAVDVGAVSVRLRLSSIIASRIAPDKRVRLATWIWSGFPSKTTSTGSWSASSPAFGA